VDFANLQRGHRSHTASHSGDDGVGAALLLSHSVLALLSLLVLLLVLLVLLVLFILLISVEHLRCVCMERFLWMCRLCMNLPVLAVRLHHAHVAANVVIFMLHLLLDPCHLHEHILLCTTCNCLAVVAWHCLSMRLL